MVNTEDYYCEVPECSIGVKTPFSDRICCFDSCILPEVKMLWEAGVRTVCSCCGHGRDEYAYIRVDKNDAETMLGLGYEPFEKHECQIYRNSCSFRAKNVKHERDTNRPIEGSGDIEAIRALWWASTH